MLEVVPGFGWNNTLVLTNEVFEIIVTLDVGPRIISFRRLDGENVLGVMNDQLGGTEEPDFKLRGGHRLWLAPENADTYQADNQPVHLTKISEHQVQLTAPAEARIEKSLELELQGNKLKLVHQIKALTNIAEPVAAWALTILRKGGTAIVPQPTHTAHPGHADNQNEAAYLPNRHLSLWAYTDIQDKRITWDNPIRIQQQPSSNPLKLGFMHRESAVHYDLASERFTKTVSLAPDAYYPDGNCNLEIYTDDEILELETLSPLTTLAKGESIIHEEFWSITKLS